MGADELADLIKARLSTVEDLGVYDGEVPTGKDEPGNYVVFYLTMPRHESRRLSDDASVHVYTLTTMSVGTSPWQCRVTAQDVHATLTRHCLTAAATPIRLGTPGQVREDTSINPPKWISTDVWRFAAPA